MQQEQCKNEKPCRTGLWTLSVLNDITSHYFYIHTHRLGLGGVTNLVPSFAISPLDYRAKQPDIV